MRKTLKLMFFIAIVMVSIIPSGCKVPKEAVMADTGLPETYSGSTVDTSNIALIPWEQFFSIPELKELIGEAIGHNNDLRVAIKHIEEATLVLRQAKWANVPTLALQAGANGSRPSDNSLNGLTLGNFLHQSHVEDYTLAASLSWEADLWGKIRSQKAEALAELLRSNEAKNAIQTRLVSDVAKGYYNLLMLDEQLEIAKKNVQLNDSTLQMIQLQFDAGQVSYLAVQQAQAQKLDAEYLVPQFEQQIVIQENAMSVLTGKYPQAIHRSAVLKEIKFGDKLSPGIPVHLLSRRPDVKVAELVLSKANAEVGYAKASLYPSLNITAQGGLEAFKASNWFEIPSSLFGAVAGGLTQPLLNQRKLRTTYRVAKVHREQAMIDFRQSILMAVGDVADNLVKIEKYQQQSVFAIERVQTLRNATANSRMLFGNGLATYLEVLTAQSSVLQSELTLASVTKAQLEARVDLYRALGGGWE